MAHRKPLEVVLLLALLAATQAALAANMYRYVDDNGRTVFNSFIPPEFVSRGYEILDERGRVIQVVPRALTPEEIAAREAAEAEALRQQEAARLQAEADAALRLRYRSPEQIAEERDQTLAMVDADLALARENLARAEADLEGPEASLAAVTAEGAEPSPALLEELEAKRGVVERFRLQVERLVSDRATLVANTERDIQRLRELLGLPEQPAAE